MMDRHDRAVVDHVIALLRAEDDAECEDVVWRAIQEMEAHAQSYA